MPQASRSIFAFKIRCAVTGHFVNCSAQLFVGVPAVEDIGTAMKHRRTLFILIALQIAFVSRVVGQLLVANNLAPWLPRFEQWQSGLLPYPVLVVSQFAIIALQTTIASGIANNTKFFIQPHPKLARALKIGGWIYFASMIVRYIIRMAIMPDQRWFGGIIPIIFHCILATYVLTLAGHFQATSSAT